MSPDFPLNDEWCASALNLPRLNGAVQQEKYTPCGVGLLHGYCSGPAGCVWKPIYPRAGPTAAKASFRAFCARTVTVSLEDAPACASSGLPGTPISRLARLTSRVDTLSEDGSRCRRERVFAEGRVTMPIRRLAFPGEATALASLHSYELLFCTESHPAQTPERLRSEAN